MHEPRPIDEIPAELCRELESFFTDIDDTITQDGLLLAESYGALWELHRAGLEVVVVTGRPAGWCDHIARMWPVAAVIGENGAFYYAYDRQARRMQRRNLISEEERREGRRRLERVRERVLAEVPGCGIAADQPFRLVDLAVDFREDVEPLGSEAVEAICRIAAQEGAVCKVSSIHVNCWYGSFDKVSGVRRFLEDRGRELSEERQRRRILFTGDSPNDEPMFRALPHTVAMANIASFLPQLAFPPEYITRQESARGFAEAVEIILGRLRSG
ncbi:MAG: HAD-IIB family hydrolase [Spirochaetales bacterium]|nr:HAD-IIB family hydrolase [Spirochaetales bacterium]